MGQDSHTTNNTDDRGKWYTRCLTLKLILHVGSFSIPHVVAVIKDLSDDVILGLDLGDAFDELLLNHILEHKHTVKHTEQTWCCTE